MQTFPEIFRVLLERLVMVDDSDDWSVTHRSLLTRHAMRPVFGATSCACVPSLKGNYAETPGLGSSRSRVTELDGPSSVEIRRW